MRRNRKLHLDSREKIHYIYDPSHPFTDTYNALISDFEIEMHWYRKARKIIIVCHLFIFIFSQFARPKETFQTFCNTPTQTIIPSRKYVPDLFSFSSILWLPSSPRLASTRGICCGRCVIEIRVFCSGCIRECFSFFLSAYCLGFENNCIVRCQYNET